MSDVKEQYPNERKAAKTMNFGIAYGLSARSVSQQLNISHPEAKDVIDKWYNNKQEVRFWKRDSLMGAMQTGSTKSLFGRKRTLPYIADRRVKYRSRSER